MKILGGFFDNCYFNLISSLGLCGIKVEKVDKNGKPVFVLDDDEEKENEDWLSSPPKVSCDARVLAENSTIRELR